MASAPLDRLHPKVRELVEELGWTLTPIQNESMAEIVDGKHRLLLAPTGSGKTEAAVLPLASRALEEGWEGLSILYVTPLRALNRDIDRRLAEMLEPLGLSVGLRHGDTSQKERTRQSRNPPNLLSQLPRPRKSCCSVAGCGSIWQDSKQLYSMRFTTSLPRSGAHNSSSASSV